MEDNIEKIWNEDEWTFQARQIIKGIREFPENSKLILILRHSHRMDSHNVSKMINLALTPQGQEIAKKFGELLPRHKLIRLFYSLSSRCKETAENILIGFKKINGKGEMKGALEPLSNLGSSSNFITSQAFKFTVNQFVIRWASGLYPPELIMPFTDYYQNAANIIWHQIKKSPQTCIDIHITHDIHLMALRLGWFGIPPENDWPSFLGGFIFTFQKNYVKFFNFGKVDFIEIPSWWRNY